MDGINIVEKIRNVIPGLTFKEYNILRTEFACAIKILKCVSINNKILYALDDEIAECRKQNLLQYAINNGYTNIVRFLIKLFIIIPNIITPMQITYSIFTSIILKKPFITNLLTNSFLNKKNIITKNINGIILKTCYEGNENMLDMLIDINEVYPLQFQCKQYTALVLAAKNGKLNIVKKLLNMPSLFNSISESKLYEIAANAKLFQHYDIELLILESIKYKKFVKNGIEN